MSDGSAQPNPETPAGGATAVKARRSWRLPADKTPERPDYAVVRRLVLGSALMLFLRTGTDPLARLQCRAPELLLQFRPARFVPRHRARLPDRQAQLLGAAGRTDHPGRAGDLHLPRAGDHRPGRRPDHLLHLAEHHRAARLAGAAADLHPGRRRAGRAGRGGRPVLRLPAAADRLPLGSRRVADRHHLVHPDVLPAGAVGGLGHRGDHRFRAADQQVAAVPGRRRRAGDDRGAAGRDAVPRDLLVAVLQDPHRRPGGRRHPAHRHLRQRGAAPDHAVGAAATAGGTAVWVPLRAIPREPAEQCADHRRRLRFRCGDRAVQGRQAHRRGGHRPADHGHRRREEPRPAVLRPQGDQARQRRPGLPGDHRHQVRPDPVRVAGFAGAGHRCLADPAGEFPVHRTGADRRPRSPHR